MCPQSEDSASKAESSRTSNAGAAASQDVFDVRKIRRFIELMDEYDLSEMDLRQGETRIQLRRGGEAPPAGVPARPAAAPAPAPLPTAEPVRAAAPAAPVDDASIKAIKSPIVGTFYTAPDPESPPYIKVGDHVGVGSTVCIIEAMKVFNEIQSEVAGKVVAVLVENGEPVEFGQPLFKVDTRQ